MRGAADRSVLAVAAIALTVGLTVCGGEAKQTSLPRAGPASVTGRGTPTMVERLEPNATLESAMGLARSHSAEDQASLLKSLGTEAFLARLDSREESLRLPAQRLHLARVIVALSANPVPAARTTLVGLIGSPAFVANDARSELLVRALATLRPPPAEAIRFWNERSGEDAIETPLVIQALCDNGSDPAIALLEKKLADPAHDPDAKRGWILGPILEHRNDAPLLKGCGRLLASTLPATLRPVLVDALFDYRREWYRSETPPVPPDRKRASPEARDELRRIGRYALDKVKLGDAQRRAVVQALKEIGG